MRRLGLLCLGFITSLLALPACCESAKQPVAGWQLVEQLEQETVALVNYYDNAGDEVDPVKALDPDVKATLRAYCTGVWVGPTTILTAEHCVDDIGKPSDPVTTTLQKLLDSAEENGPLQTWSPVGQPVMYSVRSNITPGHFVYWSAKVVAVDMDNDLALLHTSDGFQHPVAVLASGQIHDGDVLHLMGHTVGMWWSYKRGYVSAHRSDWDKTEKGVDALQVSAPIFGGDSGGGAFNENGELVGIADAVRKGVPDMGFYIHRDVVRGFLITNGVIKLKK